MLQKLPRLSIVLTAVVVSLAPASLSAQAVVTYKPYQTDLAAVNQQTEVLVSSIRRGDRSSEYSSIQTLLKARDESGLENLEATSGRLLNEAEQELKTASGKAGIFYRRALELSPTSSSVCLRAVSVASNFGVSALVEAALRAITTVWSSPMAVVRGSSILFTLFLWAMTFALYCVLVFRIALSLPEIMRSAAGYWPANIRGIVTPITVVLMIILPLLGGLIFSLAAWSIILWASNFKGRKIVLTLSSFTILAWAIVFPVVNRLEGWQESEEKRSVLLASSGLAPNDMVAHPTGDTLAKFLYAQLLRKNGELQAASKVLEKVELVTVYKHLALAERAILAAMQGDISTAKALMNDAEESGANGADFHFNASKIAMLDFDTALAKEHIVKAELADPVRFDRLRNREESLGVNHPATWADVRLSTLGTVKALWDEDRTPQEYGARAVVFLGGSAGATFAIGMALLVLTFVRSPAERRKGGSAYYGDFRSADVIKLAARWFPGGGWLLINRPGWSWLFVSIVCFSVMPALGWPSEAICLTVAVPRLENTMLMIAGLMTAISYTLCLLCAVRSYD